MRWRQHVVQNSFTAQLHESAQLVRFAWLARLADTLTPAGLAALLVEFVSAQIECTAAVVIRGLAGAETRESEPAGPLAAADLDMARACLTSVGEDPVVSVDGTRVAIAICEEPVAALVITMVPSADFAHWTVRLNSLVRLASRYFCREMELQELRSSLVRQKRSEQLQRSFFAISDLAGSDRDMPEMLRSIHAIVGTLMYAENFELQRSTLLAMACELEQDESCHSAGCAWESQRARNLKRSR